MKVSMKFVRYILSKIVKIHLELVGVFLKLYFNSIVYGFSAPTEYIQKRGLKLAKTKRVKLEVEVKNER